MKKVLEVVGIVLACLCVGWATNKMIQVLSFIPYELSDEPIVIWKQFDHIIHFNEKANTITLFRGCSLYEISVDLKGKLVMDECAFIGTGIPTEEGGMVEEGGG